MLLRPNTSPSKFSWLSAFMLPLLHPQSASGVGLACEEEIAGWGKCPKDGGVVNTEIWEERGRQWELGQGVGVDWK